MVSREWLGGVQAGTNFRRTASKALHARGRKLVLQYTDGSPCGPSSRHRSATDDYKDYDEPAQLHPSDSDKPQRKSTTISFLCDHDATAPHASVHFVAASPDECAYFFEARSRHACASAEPRQPGSVGPGGVFALIFGIALVVYFAGGVVYQRTVENARGWRQLPNHTVWQGIWNFIKVSYPRRGDVMRAGRKEGCADWRRTLRSSASRRARGCVRAGGGTRGSRDRRAGGGTARTRTGLLTSLTRSGTTDGPRVHFFSSYARYICHFCLVSVHKCL